MKLYIVSKATIYNKFLACGIELGEVIYQDFNNCSYSYTKVKNLKEVMEDDITAVVYNDTPFVTLSKLKELAQNIKNGIADGYKIGDGYIRLKGTSLSNAEVVQTLKVDSFETYETAKETFKRQIFENHIKNGVKILDFNTTFIDYQVKIGKDTIVHPMNYIKGDSEIGKSAIINPYNDLTNVKIGNGTDISASFAVDTLIGTNCTVGPFATFRKGSVVKDRCRVGNYVEIKNSTLEDDVKAAHLAYVGDSYVGENTNIGCGVIFANYDGVQKRGVTVQKNAFIGCNTNLIAPVSVGENAYIAAGSTITQDVPSNSLGIARGRQTNKIDWQRPT